MNKYTQAYTSVSDIDLLKIIKNSPDYEKEAVLAAQKEITNRNLSEEEHSKLLNELEAEINDKTTSSHNTDPLIEKVNPFAKGISQTVKHQRIQDIFIVIFSLLDLLIFLRYKFHLSMIPLDEIQSTNTIIWQIIFMFLFSLPYIVLLLGSITFLMRKRIGWILFNSFLVFFSVFYLTSFLSGNEYFIYNTSWVFVAENLWYIFELAKPVCIIIFIKIMYSKSILSRHHINLKTIIITVIIATAVSIFASL